MDTLRTSVAVTKDYHGSEVSAEITAALAASSIVLRKIFPRYSNSLLARSQQVFKFADTYRGSYNNSKAGHYVCPFCCDFSGYQVDYILGNNPLKTSYMVDFGQKFPHRIHHRGSSMPSIKDHKGHIGCKDGTPYYASKGYNPNLLTRAVVGGPDKDDKFADDRNDPGQSESTTYINAPLVGLLAYFSEN